MDVDADLRPWPPRGHLSSRARGYLMGVTAIVVISPDSLLLRLCTGEDPIMVTIMRSSWLVLFTLLTSVLETGGVRALLRVTAVHWRPVLLIGTFCTGTQLGYAYTFQLTDTAEGFLLISLNPLWAALVGVRVLGDELPRRTMLALAVAIAAVTLIFAPRLLSAAPMPRNATQHVASHHADAPVHPYRHLGDAIALATGACQAGFITSVRYTKLRYAHDVPVHVAQSLSNCGAGLLSALILLLLRRPFRLAAPARTTSLTLTMGFIVNLAYLGMNRAPAYISSVEFSIICLLETLLGPLFVFLFLGDEPPPSTLAGGALLLAALIAHECAAARPAPPPPRCAPEGGCASSYGDGVKHGGPSCRRGQRGQREAARVLPVASSTTHAEARPATELAESDRCSRRLEERT